MADDLPILLFAGPDHFEEWLEGNAADSPGLWLKIAKKGAPEPSITYAEALEVALCFGWIDSQKRGLDDSHFLQRFTPRRPRGRWSKINREKCEALEAAGALRPARACACGTGRPQTLADAVEYSHRRPSRFSRDPRPGRYGRRA